MKKLFCALIVTAILLTACGNTSGISTADYEAAISDNQN